MAGLGFIGLFMYSALYYFGIEQLSSQEACILNYLWPIMIVLFACVILKEKLVLDCIARAKEIGFTQLGVIPNGFRMKDGHFENICPYYRELGKQ